VLIKEEGEEFVRNLLAKIFKVEPIKIPKVTWGHRQEFNTTDPFNELKINLERDVIILRETLNPKTSIWLLHYLRGAIMYQILGDIEDNIMGWNFCALFSLLLTTSSEISVPIRGKYISLWDNVYATQKNFDTRLDFRKLYFMLDTFTPNQKKDVLFEFIKFNRLYPNTKLEVSFNYFLYSFIPKTFSNLDIQVLFTSLQNQTLNAAIISKSIPKVKTNAIYKSLEKLKFSLIYLFYPKKSYLGLVPMYLFNLSQPIINTLKESPYYENYEKFKSPDKRLEKIKFPFYYLNKLLEKLNSIKKLNNEFIIILPDEWENIYSPNMYDPDSSSWLSVKTHRKQVIRLRGNRDQNINIHNYHRYNLTNSELIVLMDIVNGKTDKIDSIITTITRSKVKKIKPKLEELKYYNKIIMWRIPMTLKSITLFIPLSIPIQIYEIDKKLITEDEFRFQLLEYIEEKLTENTEGINYLLQLKKTSWPYLSVEYGYEFNKSLELKKVAKVQIYAIDDDLTPFEECKYFFGRENQGTGTILKFPLDLYNFGQWDYDIPELVKLLS